MPCLQDVLRSRRPQTQRRAMDNIVRYGGPYGPADFHSSNFLLPTSYFHLPTNYFLLPPSYCLLLTSSNCFLNSSPASYNSYTVVAIAHIKPLRMQRATMDNIVRVLIDNIVCYIIYGVCYVIYGVLYYPWRDAVFKE